MNTQTTVVSSIFAVCCVFSALVGFSSFIPEIYVIYILVSYRELLKKNPRKFSEYRQRERERKRLNWRNRTEVQINEDRRKARERQQRYRLKIYRNVYLQVCIK